jgi:hypothetical protein
MSLAYNNTAASKRGRRDMENSAPLGASKKAANASRTTSNLAAPKSRATSATRATSAGPASNALRSATAAAAARQPLARIGGAAAAPAAAAAAAALLSPPRAASSSSAPSAIPTGGRSVMKARGEVAARPAITEKLRAIFARAGEVRDDFRDGYAQVLERKMPKKGWGTELRVSGRVTRGAGWEMVTPVD